MASKVHPVVLDASGTRGRIRDLAIEGVHPTHAEIELEDGSIVTVPTEALHPRPDGGYTIDGLWRALVARSARGVAVPKVEETLKVGKRQRVRERVRVRRRVVSEPRVVDVPVRREEIVLERVPIDRVVTEAPRVRREGDVLVIPRCVEEVVVETRLRLVEEVRIRVVGERTIERRTISVRRHELDVIREPETTKDDKEES
jgi:uncharacterized protein (TIGR02271 family)